MRRPRTGALRDVCRNICLPTVVGLMLALLPLSEMRAQKVPTLDPVPGIRVGNVAADFTLKDLENQPHSLKELRGKRVVQVVFWATWCVPCLQEIPGLRAAQTKYQDRGLQILGIVINMDQTVAKVKATARDMKINYPILWDDGGEVQDKYRVSLIPQNFLIGKDGVIRYAGSSIPSNYDALLESLLKEGETSSKAGQEPLGGASGAPKPFPLPLARIDDPRSGD